MSGLGKDKGNVNFNFYFVQLKNTKKRKGKKTPFTHSLFLPTVYSDKDVVSWYDNFPYFYKISLLSTLPFKYCKWLRITQKPDSSVEISIGTWHRKLREAFVKLLIS